MRQALLTPLPRERAGTSSAVNLPAPTGGLNTRDSLAEMHPLDAVTLNNWFPRSGECVLRGGSSSFASSMTGTVKSLYVYSPTSGTKKLLAVTNSGIYDITAGGVIGAVVKALTNGYLNAVNITNSVGTSFFWAANGTDKPVLYDGATWTSLDGASTPAITGVTTTSLVYPWLFKHRIFCIEKNSFNVWYLPIDSLGGAAVQFPLGNLFRRGGSLLSGTSWTLDGGDGADDLCVIATTEGEVAVYKGTDPSSASSWALVGVFYVGKPVGRRCFFRLGGDVGMLTESGVFPLARLLQSGNVNFLSALSNKIQPTYTDAVVNIGLSTEGWEGTVYPTFDALVVNVPAAGIFGAAQFVMNTITGAWCLFSNWPAFCFVTFNGVLYFGCASGVVRKAWDGSLKDDLGVDITATAQTAWQYFSGRTALKRVEAFRPLLAFDGQMELRWGIAADYALLQTASALARGAGVVGATWDVSPWDTTTWTPLLQRTNRWLSARHFPGYAIALGLQTVSNNCKLSWSGTDFVVRAGGLL